MTTSERQAIFEHCATVVEKTVSETSEGRRALRAAAFEIRAHAGDPVKYPCDGK